MYICTRCGEVTDKLPQFHEPHPIGEGYADEILCSNRCHCGGDYAVAEKCSVCGQVKNAEETDFFDGICEDCLKAKAQDFVLVRKCADLCAEPVTVSVNPLVYHLLSPESINSILWNYLDNCCTGEYFGELLKVRYRQKAKEWAESDLSWFRDALEEVRKNEQNGA